MRDAIQILAQEVVPPPVTSRRVAAAKQLAIALELGAIAAHVRLSLAINRNTPNGACPEESLSLSGTLRDPCSVGVTIG